MMGGEKLPGRKYSIEPLGVRKRVSTDVLTVSDPHVAKAIAFIRQKAHEHIQVEDVLSIVPLSRRALETQFRQALNRTPHQEILRVRTNAVRELLLETNMSLSDMSEALGTVFFKKETGLTPREYRDQVRGRSCEVSWPIAGSLGMRARLNASFQGSTSRRQRGDDAQRRTILVIANGREQEIVELAAEQRGERSIGSCCQPNPSSRSCVKARRNPLR